MVALIITNHTPLVSQLVLPLLPLAGVHESPNPDTCLGKKCSKFKKKAGGLI